jgi:hypothetical protein
MTIVDERLGAACSLVTAAVEGVAGDAGASPVLVAVLGEFAKKSARA